MLDEQAEMIQDQLQQLSIQIGQPQDEFAIRKLYQNTEKLLSHLSVEPLTLARVAGILLVYEQPGTDPDEVKWFKNALENCQDAESIEELIDSISRPDAL
jgi:hypothetical protein